MSTGRKHPALCHRTPPFTLLTPVPTPAKSRQGHPASRSFTCRCHRSAEQGMGTEVRVCPVKALTGWGLPLVLSCHVPVTEPTLAASWGGRLPLKGPLGILSLGKF